MSTGIYKYSITPYAIAHLDERRRLMSTYDTMTAGSVFETHGILSVLENYRKRDNGILRSLSDGLALACLMADFSVVVEQESFPKLMANNYEEVYSRLEKVVFIDEHGEPVDPGMTIGVSDLNNYRHLYVVVLRPGRNIVFVQATEVDAVITQIALLAPAKIKAVNRQSNPWRDGNNFDKAMFALTFGFEYDKADDEILIPPGRIASNFELGRIAAEENIADLRSIGAI